MGESKFDPGASDISRYLEDPPAPYWITDQNESIFSEGEVTLRWQYLSPILYCVFFNMGLYHSITIMMYLHTCYLISAKCWGLGNLIVEKHVGSKSREVAQIS